MGFSEFQKRDKNETKSDDIESRLWKEERDNWGR